MTVQNDFNLIQHNTFKLNSMARYFAELTDVSDLAYITKFAKEKNVPIRVLGGGSNLILPEKIEALVVHNKLLGSRIVQETADFITVACSSGMNWHEFVMSTISQHQFGLENLALIPGTVGGAPIQNVGAYGVEVNKFITRVHGFDFDTETTKSLLNQECLFEYRNSIFKTDPYKNFFITEVEFQLLKKPNPNISYAELAHAFNGLPARPQDVAQKVIEVRTKKLPDVNIIPNVGSFFKNPIVSAQKLALLKQATPDLVSYLQPDGQYKLAAGQLIDKLGFKGRQQGFVSMYEKQALVMVNLGNGRREDVIKLADCIRQACLEVFDVALETEPIFW